MRCNLSARDQLDRDFLELRRRLLDVAAGLDRIDRAGGADMIRTDARVTMLRRAAMVLTDDCADRAERVQMVFSDEYDDNWRGR
ncbi:MAG: hypothetical protein ACE5HE_11690 [Phycisphaerae bacterium]